MIYCYHRSLIRGYSTERHTTVTINKIVAWFFFLFYVIFSIFLFPELFKIIFSVCLIKFSARVLMTYQGSIAHHQLW